MSESRTPHLRAHLEQLEVRDIPSAAGVWQADSFDQVAAPALPVGWAGWSNDGQQQFITSRLQVASAPNALASLGSSSVESRLWKTATVPADYGVAASVRADAPATLELIARGRNLNTSTPSYVAAVVKAGGTFELVQEVNGVRTLLGTVRSTSVSTGWLRVTVRPVGEFAWVQVQRADTGQYLNAAGQWQTAAVDALSGRVGRVSGEFTVGIGRDRGGSGMAYVDDFAVMAPPGANQTFDSTAANTLPPNWQSWSSDGVDRAKVGTARSSSPSSALSIDGTSVSRSRAWLNSEIAADASATAEVFVDNLTPAGVLSRGQNLNSATPTFYSLTVTRGLTVQLKKTVNGVETVLGTVRSTAYSSQLWLKLTLVTNGDRLQAVVQRQDTGLWLSSSGAWVSTLSAAMTVSDSSIRGSGYVGVDRGRLAVGGIWFDDVEIRPVDGSIPVGGGGGGGGSPGGGGGNTGGGERPGGVRKYDHIRVSMLAYAGNPAGTFEQNLARDSVDLIVVNPTLIQRYETAAADTPKVIYTNTSNLYGDLLTDWLKYADQTAADREAAFFHVTQATAYTGQSASAVPVNYFWGVYRVNVDGSGTPVNQTSEAKGGRATGVKYGGVGTAVLVGWTDRFREVNVTLKTAAGSGWLGAYEYVSAVDASGNPTQWKTLPLVSDGTGGMKRAGQVTFDPPADWKASKQAGGGAWLYQIRLRTTAGTSTTAPEAGTLLGRDYVGANGGRTGTIPAFDTTADRNGDGYLSDAEYATRRTGFNARFVHESRLFYPYYGPMRFVVNPASAAVKNWAADYHARLLQTQPLADGFFVDNAHGKLPFAGTPVRESVANYTADAAAVVQAVSDRLPGKWIVANTAGSIAEGDAVAAASTAAFEEFVLRPNDVNWTQVRDISDLVTRRLNSDTPSPYLILDTHPGSKPTTDERTRRSTLAYYYLLADPDKTFLNLFGGYAPSAAWSQLWIPAVGYDVGDPTAAMSVFATGQDPQNAALKYEVFGRTYENALVLFKAKAYTLGRGTGTTDDATATTHTLGGNYRVLNADGTTGPVVNRITLRGGEGLVLVKA